MTTALQSFDALTDDQLLIEVKRLAARERSATAALLQSLMEVDARKLYLREGFSSLFTYCTQALHLAEGAAYNRIETARAARRFPVILEAIADGALTLTSTRLLAPHLTEENQHDLISASRHKSKRDVELLIASIHPKPAVATIVRKQPVAHQPAARVVITAGDAVASASMSEKVATVDAAAEGEAPPRSRATPLASSPSAASTNNRSATIPLSADTYKLQVTISAETHARLRRAQDLLRHSIPSGDLAAVFDRALTLLLADLERRRCASVVTPRSGQPGRSRHIPAAVRREVWQRDEGRCAFTSGGHRCAETAFLEFHHVEPYAAGGAATVGNVQLRCRAHNQYEATLIFGPRADSVREVAPAW